MRDYRNPLERPVVLMTSSSPPREANMSNNATSVDVAIAGSSMEMDDLIASAGQTTEQEATPLQAASGEPVKSNERPMPQQPEPAHLKDSYDGQIQAATEDTNAVASSTSERAVNITLLLITGNRHPFCIDEKYLRKRGVVGSEVVEGSADPFSISVYTLRELIWKDWRDEWEPRPTSPHSIRLINFGKILEDKMTLSECRFNANAPTVIHMTIKPQDVGDDDDGKTGKGGYGRDREDSERGAGCRCVIL